GIDRLYLWRRKLRHLELRQFALVHRRERMVVRASASASLVGARWQLRNVFGNIQRRNVGVFSNRLSRLRNFQKEGNQDQRKHARMHADRGNLRPAEVLILRPDVFHFDWFDRKRQRGHLRREEEVPNPVAKSAKTRIPPACKLSFGWPLWHGPRPEELTQISPETAAIIRWHQRRTVISANPHWPLKQKLFQVRPEIVRHQDRRPTELGDAQR